MTVVGIGLFVDMLTHKIWPSLASVLLVIVLALWSKKNHNRKPNSQAAYKSYLKLIFPDGVHKPQVMATVYGFAIGGFVGGMVAAGYSDHQSLGLVAFGVFGGAVAGVYLLLQLIPVIKSKKGHQTVWPLGGLRGVWLLSWVGAVYDGNWVVRLVDE